MRYAIEHITEYHYSQPVGLSLQLAHLRPRDTDWQKCLSHSLLVSPGAVSQHDGRDYFGNGITRFEIEGAHHVLSVSARSEVEIHREPWPAADALPDWQTVRAAFAETMWGTSEASIASEFLFASSHVPQLNSLRDFAAACFEEGGSILDGALALTHYIHEEFEFDPTATHVTTPVETVLSIRRGVCQDFAHLMIASLRSLGLPARYVSGYLLTEPPPGQPRLVGADASHAWVALYVPEYGWLEFDPTNDCMAGDAHITLAWGRDFADVSPLRGVILGGGEHTVDVGVTVTPLSRPEKPRKA